MEEIKMNIINSFTKVISAIIACAIVLMVIIPYGIGLEFISAYKNDETYNNPQDVYFNSEDIAKKPIVLLGAGTYNITLDNVYLDRKSTRLNSSH